MMIGFRCGENSWIDTAIPTKIDDFKDVITMEAMMFTFEDFKYYYEAAADHEPEFYLRFKDRDSEYIIIKYDDGPTFQRCGFIIGSGEYKYASLNELYCADQIDDINLKRDWPKLCRIYPNGYGIFEEYCNFFKIEYRGELEDVSV